MILRRIKIHIEKENWFAVGVDFFYCRRRRRMSDLDIMNIQCSPESWQR
jgi:hypothetical protein